MDHPIELMVYIYRECENYDLSTVHYLINLNSLPVNFNI